ncbi:hypothetical protein COD21_31245 [Bacillus cereus]|uniref:hypothetical protein n=1 Tax=Bacillus cereus TaxID=1396 RepID=UPI000BFC4691|nr:hypothetical protein [Bacillus cereus]PGT99572.1 hypothetical protein COD21_31245 [Bacillus cereus]
MEVTGKSIITVKGRQVIKVKTNLVSKDKINQKLEMVEQPINEQFRKLLGIGGDLVKFSFDGFLACQKTDFGHYKIY